MASPDRDRPGLPALRRDARTRDQSRDDHAQLGALTAEVTSVVTPIRLLMRSAAAADPEMAALVAASDDEPLERMGHHARFLQQRGYVRQGVTLAEATDALWTCSSVELYELLVLKRGWSTPRFAAFIADFMIAALLPGSGQ